MHWTGLAGMPRRIYTYPEGLGWSSVNLVTTIGAFILAIGVLLLLVNVIVSLRSGAVAGADPWRGPTLEWTLPSPPPPYDFAVIPAVASRHPLWENALSEDPDRSTLDRGLTLDRGKEMLATTALDAEPDAIQKMPDDTLTPLFTALAATALAVAALLHAWIAAGVVTLFLLAALLAWLWPRRRLAQVSEPGHE